MIGTKALSASFITATFAEPFEAKAASAPAVSGTANPEPFLTYMLTGGLPPIAGPAVTPASAMSVPVVKACVELIAGAIGSLPVKVYQEAAAGGRAEAPEHPAYDLVHYDANDHLDAGQLREQLVVDALLHGSGYGLVRRNAKGMPLAIWRVPPEAVTIATDQITGDPFFKIATTRGHEIVPSGDMLYIPAPCSLDGLNGTAPIQRARNAISLALAMEAHVSRLFSNGARPSGILSFPASANVKSKGAEQALAAFENHSTGSNSGKPYVLFDGAKWDQLEFSTVDLQFVQLREAQTHEIARALNVPPTMIGELAKATLSNSETMARQFLQHTLMPWIRTFRAAYRRTLILREDRRTYSIDFVTDGLLQADSAQRAAFYSAMRAAGIMTANECRRLENQPAHPDGDTLASPHTTANTAPAPENPVV